MQTLDLLDKAVAKSKSERALSRELGLDATALATARHRGKLSTAITIALADHLGENVLAWVLQAEQENEKSEPLKKTLASIKKRLNS